MPITVKMSQLTQQGQTLSLFYDSFDKSKNLNDINVVTQISKTHGEDITSLSFMGDKAMLEFFFHGRPEDIEYTANINQGGADDEIDFHEQAGNFPVTIVTLNQLQAAVAKFFPEGNLVPYFREGDNLGDEG